MLEQNNNVITQKIGTGIELMIEGLPQSMITPDQMSQASLELVKYGIPMGASFTAGLIGQVGKAGLKIGSKYYQIKFAFRAMRAITALEVYSEAIEWINYRKSRGLVDPILADDTINILRQDLRDHQQRWRLGG